MIGFAMFTRGHIHDTTIPMTIQSWGALDFFREILKKDPADVAALFELWAVSRERGTQVLREACDVVLTACHPRGYWQRYVACDAAGMHKYY